ncbi:ABC transporter ATP-binding protein [Candidatus Berkiella aquae]|uniref:ABC transporter ATP-binding protein n=1 Tax=Candidatus Berkiella aquae TaxID=295108 RepID=A0A0Q9Z068_9GAMM|nr:ABC transporter ATP-binding protein [Candidatus Berkiella aquae]MCS5712382.1 ABC transporter ATP-binding protein [Candidatus Berkiella aquae]
MKALNIRNLQKIYDNGTQALKGIDLEVAEGDFFGLLGPNGAGKSTTIGIISSLVVKTAGQIEIFGHDLDKDTTVAKRLLGLVPQEFNFNVFEKCIDILTNQAGYYGIEYAKAKERAEYYLKRLGLWDKAYDPARTLSGGLKRRLMIARGLIHDPKILILDEPTAGVDIELRRTLWAFLKELNEKGITIILTTHYLEEAESLCKQIAIINHGELIENTSIKRLIATLHRETLVLDLKEPIATLPQLSGFEFVQNDNVTLEVSFSKESSINHLFTALSQLGIEVTSLRNKTNRLEELFLNLVTQK